MKDEDLKTQTDYVAGQREAARRVLIEIGNILRDYRSKMMVIGGWVPDLYFPDKGHIGSIDVDLLLDHNSLVAEYVSTVARKIRFAGTCRTPRCSRFSGLFG